MKKILLRLSEKDLLRKYDVGKFVSYAQTTLEKPTVGNSNQKPTLEISTSKPSCPLSYGLTQMHGFVYLPNLLPSVADFE